MDSASPEEVLGGSAARALLLSDTATSEDQGYVSRRVLKALAESDDASSEILSIGNAALAAFLQANVTGPPLTWNPTRLIPSQGLLKSSSSSSQDVKARLTASLSVDGEAVYQHIPYLELFVLAKILLTEAELIEDKKTSWARLRVNVWHQRLLGHPSGHLQKLIEKDLESLDRILSADASVASTEKAFFFLERATIHSLHGLDNQAKADLRRAARERQFHFALTGRLGKRTKFQEKSVSQLVVLAKSSGAQSEGRISTANIDRGDDSVDVDQGAIRPQTLALNDDTLLDSISFSDVENSSLVVQGEENLLPDLASLDPGNQPILDPFDSIILLATASSITNTSPQDGLTREETLPFAERVLSGGSSNWQVYTQALIIRSRIEGYKTRTIERGVLQLQAVVDQVIAETTPDGPPVEEEDVGTNLSHKAPTTFLPRPSESESAPVSERLKYIHQLGSPTRWKLEAELADRWVGLGALRTALEIYERLEMWAEVALCLAANNREKEARDILRRELFLPPRDRGDTPVGNAGSDIVERPMGFRESLPLDAPRLLCILGDIEQDPNLYESAWTVSNHRYARAQRSLGRHYMNKKDFKRADEAYAASLKVDPQNHPSWFTLGCIRLQTEDWPGAVDAFGRAVQIDDSDAESWSNMAVALINLPKDSPSNEKNLKAALIATKRATSLKRENVKLWQNLLAIAVKLSPPPYPEIIMAQSRLVEKLGPSQGETAVDVPIVEALLSLVFEDESGDSSKATGTRKLVIDLVLQKIAPLVTSSRPLWLLIAKLYTHLRRPSPALSTYEKAWRSALNQPGWESNKKLWENVSEATIDLLDAYESLGEMSRESGLGAGEPVAKDWKFKSRSAVRSVLARAKEAWEDDGAYERLNERLQELKSS